MAHELYFEDVAVGHEFPKLEKPPVDKNQIWRYAGASGDFNPLHMDDEWGQMAGLGGRIAHGMLIMGFVGQAVTGWVPKKHLKKLMVRFGGMTRPGDAITITGKVSEKRTEGGRNIVIGEITAKDQKNDIKATGTFEAELPQRSA